MPLVRVIGEVIVSPSMELGRNSFPARTEDHAITSIRHELLPRLHSGPRVAERAACCKSLMQIVGHALFEFCKRICRLQSTNRSTNRHLVGRTCDQTSLERSLRCSQDQPHRQTTGPSDPPAHEPMIAAPRPAQHGVCPWSDTQLGHRMHGFALLAPIATSMWRVFPGAGEWLRPSSDAPSFVLQPRRFVSAMPHVRPLER